MDENEEIQESPEILHEDVYEWIQPVWVNSPEMQYTEETNSIVTGEGIMAQIQRPHEAQESIDVEVRNPDREEIELSFEDSHLQEVDSSIDLDSIEEMYEAELARTTKKEESIKEVFITIDDLLTIFNNHYGEEYIDFTKIGNLYKFKVWYPEIQLTSQTGKQHTIRDLYITWVFEEISGKEFRLAETRGIRRTLTYSEIIGGYGFSHMNGGYINESTSFCYGYGTPISTEISKLSSRSHEKYTSDSFEAFLYLFDTYLTWESIDGGPFTRISNIGINKLGNTNLENYHPYNTSIFEELHIKLWDIIVNNKDYLNEFIDCIDYIQNTKITYSAFKLNTLILKIFEDIGVLEDISKSEISKNSILYNIGLIDIEAFKNSFREYDSDSFMCKSRTIEKYKATDAPSFIFKEKSIPYNILELPKDELKFDYFGENVCVPPLIITMLTIIFEKTIYKLI